MDPGAEKKGKEVIALPVVYRRDLPSLDVHTQHAAEIWKATATTKLYKWSPEQEYRLIACNLPDEQLTLSPNVINIAALGANVNREEREIITDILRQRGYSIPLLQARKVVLGYNQMELRFREVEY